MAAILEQRDAILSRRSLLGRGAAVGAATGAVALGLAPALRSSASAQDDATPEGEGAENGGFEDDVAVLNYALTLEHLEFAFYRDNVDTYDLGVDGFGNSINEYLGLIRDHEGAHVETLTAVITDLGGEPVEEAEYDFGVTDAATFLATAAALENTGVSAYDGAGQYLEDADLLTAAGTIVAVEARHASYLNLITGELPFPASFETPLSMDEVLEIAGPFIQS
jgi:rubrerythrin